MTCPRYTLLSVAAVLFLAPAQAGDWHTSEQLVCSDCHTMHNSSGGQPMRYDLNATPAPHLLRHATSLSLCLYCHDGSNLDAPDVVGPVTYVSDPAAGLLAPAGQPNLSGHDLGMATPVTPPGGVAPMTLSCLTCHDHHGGPAYRNLRGDPSGLNQSPVAVVVTQTIKADGANPAQVYVPQNLVYKSGLGAWCGQCHGAFHGRTSSQEGTASPWFRHPQDQALATSANVDFDHWQQPLVNRVPVENPLDAVVPSSDDRVFCASCHKAHGSANKAALIFADGLTQRSTCQQCHNE